MEIINNIYDFLAFLKPYKFIIIAVSFILFAGCTILAQRAKKKRNEDDYDDD